MSTGFKNFLAISLGSCLKNSAQLVAYCTGLTLSGFQYGASPDNFVNSVAAKAITGSSWGIYGLIHFYNSLSVTFWPKRIGLEKEARYPLSWRIYRSIIQELMVDGASLIVIGGGAIPNTGFPNPVIITGIVLAASSIALHILPVGKCVAGCTPSTDAEREPIAQRTGV